MNTAPQSQAPTAVTTRTAKKVACEMKARSRSTSAKKKLLLSPKNSLSKRKTAGKVKSSAKVVSRKVKPSAGKDNPIEQVALASEPLLPTPELLIQEVQPATFAPEQNESLPTDLASPPAQLRDQCEIDSGAVVASIPASEFVEPLAADEYVLDSELVPPIEPGLTPDGVTFSDNTPPILDDAVSQVAKQAALAPMTRFWRSMAAQLTGAWNWVLEKFKSHQVRKRLRVCETVSLGEKRFLAVVQVDGEQFLVGGSSSSVSTLAHLERARDFSDVFQRRCEQDFSQA